MTHIHELIDFIIVAYVVYKDRVLLVHHKELKKWLPLGGHIEIDEDPDQALIREIREESDLEVEIFGEKPELESKGVKFLYPPIFLDIHDISKTHKHISLTYFAKAKSENVRLAEREHHDIRWFTEKDLDNQEYNLESHIKFYAREALKKFV